MEPTSRQPEAVLTSPGQRTQGLAVTPELVRKIADQVYALLQRDLAIERERFRQAGGLVSQRKEKRP